jgi:acyl-CoA thioesterase-1
VKKRIIIALCLLLVGVLGAAGTVGYLTFVRSPANPPAAACADGRSQDSRPVVVAAGASMTQGTLGADWVGALRDRPEHRGFEFVNAGVNGSTSADLRQRVDTDIVACSPAEVTILIGTNDVRDGVPLDQYRDNLGAIVDRVVSRTTARVALMSLPPLGEDLDTEINQKLSGYNAAIRQTATRARVDYLPVHEQMTDLLRQRGGDPKPYDFSFLVAFGAATQHYLFGQSWDEVARNGGRELLVDHIHLSDRGGAIVTELVAQWLSG